MKKKRLFLTVAVVAILAAIFSACPTDGADSGPNGNNNGDGPGAEWTPPVDNTEVWPIVEDVPGGFRVYFLSPTGNDTTGDGSFANPWFSLTKAQDAVNPGDTVYLRAGTYKITGDYGTQEEVGVNGSARTKILFNRSGEEGKPITYAGYPGDLPARPVLDFSTWQVTPGTGTRRSCGIAIGRNTTDDIASWIWFRAFDITGLTDYTNASNANGYVIQLNQGSHNTFENLRIYNCAGTGVFSFETRVVAYNLIKNCDFFQLHSLTNPPMNQNTDGGGFHLAQAGSVGNVFYGCRAWAVGDDGFDSIRAGSRVVYDHCWIAYTAFNYYFGRETDPDFEDWVTKLDISLLDYNGGNGNGLKLGGYGMASPINPNNSGWNGKNPGHVLRYCLAIGNHRAGVTHNYAAGSGDGTDGQSYFNTTAYNNRINFEMISQAPETAGGGGAKRRNAYGVTMKRNISYKNLQSGHELYELIDYVPGSAAQEYPVRWLDSTSGVIEDNTFGVADNGAKETHALDGVFVSSGGDTTDFDDRGGAYPNGVDAVKDIVQYRFEVKDDMFMSLDENLFLAPRKKNGDLPETKLLRPLADSPMAGMGYTAPDTNEDGFGDFWKYSGAKPVLNWNSFPFTSN
ncbi:MAG: right-handed parallel beta-helix repeat-containing protein [Treponema sp.]|nr:right-handed parallel beta-helix repeat-containing protein [Treponema sp.]